MKQIKFNRANIEDISAVTEFVEEQLEIINCPMKTIIQINVAVDEIYSNIAKFAYGEADGPVTVSLEIKENPKAILIKFEDNGIPYNPLEREDPDITLSAEERSIGGLGIFMVKKTMDNVDYRYENKTNILTIEKTVEGI
ncbi:MAG: ATP-binding protein [Clostridia bacterium]|nr:ATP-binding protein [Clostridia bacterium]